MSDDLLVFNQDALPPSSLDEIVVGRDGFTKTRASLGALWTDVRHGRCDLGPDRCLGFLDSLHQESRNAVSNHAETAAQKVEQFLRRKLADYEDAPAPPEPSTPSTLAASESASSFLSPEWQSRLNFLWYGLSHVYAKESRRLGSTIRTRIVQPSERTLRQWIPSSGSYLERRAEAASAFPDDESIGPISQDD